METTRLSVTGMNCDHCVDHVAKAIRAVKGVEGVIVSLERKSALVRHKGAVSSELIKAVELAGYAASIEEV